MRTIKFRGKRVDNGGWVYGDLLTNVSNPTLQILAFYGQYFVDKDTIGQFTGLRDKNGKEIWEGDIVTMFANINKLSDPMLSNAEPKYRLTTIVYDDASFKITFEGKPDGVLNYYSGAMVKNMEVVGNIHDNPELMKGE